MVKTLNVVIGVLIVLVITFLIAGGPFWLIDRDLCSNLKEVANEESSVQKLKQWVLSVQNSIDKHELKGNPGVFSPYVFPSEQYLNWRELGFDRSSLTIKFQTEGDRWEKINSVSIGYGYRNFLYIILSDDSDFVPPYPYDYFERFSDGVAVSCLPR